MCRLCLVLLGLALRALAQSMARELGPQGIHVVHPIIDGAIDTDFIRDNFPAMYAKKEQDGILNPEHIADSYWMLHQQPLDTRAGSAPVDGNVLIRARERKYGEGSFFWPFPKQWKKDEQMSKTVEFIFDVGSPTAYLAWTQLGAMCERTGAQLQLTPVLLGGIFKATGNNPPGAVPAKGMYMMRDLARYAQRYQVPLTMNPHFPVNTLLPMRVATAAIGTPEQDTVVGALYDAMWKAPCKLSEPEELSRVLTEAGLEAMPHICTGFDFTLRTIPFSGKALKTVF